jgi:uncharacterized protein YlzI (FlbEa/FlbD family)
MHHLENYKRFHIDFRKTDWDKILKRASAVKLKPTTFIKRSALNRAIIIYDKEVMNDMVGAINRIGNNVNQIARIANGMGFAGKEDVENVTNLLNSLKKEIGSLAKNARIIEV